LLIPRYRCRLNLQTAFLIYLPFTGAGRAWKYPNRHSRQHRNLETRHSRQHRNLETRHSRQYRNLEIRHSRAGGNPDP
ncbi:TPA: hypothetical protein ACJL98_002135, partial [Neisseria meningitidis]